MGTAGAEELDLDMPAIEQVLVRACGLSLGSGLSGTLREGIRAAAAALALPPAELAGRLLREDARAIVSLIEYTVVGESYFYRHPEQFAALQRHVLGSAEPLRIWSAGCASGEEPYSLGIALLESGRPPGRDRILATDVSERALERARLGAYGAWSLRRLPPELRARHFLERGGTLRIAPRIRALVAFERHNLARDPAPAGPFDLVLCRNVLIYFDPTVAAEVLYRLVGATRPGGFLVLGPVELPLAAPLAVEWVDAFGASLLRRPAGSPPG